MVEKETRIEDGTVTQMMNMLRMIGVESESVTISRFPNPQ